MTFALVIGGGPAGLMAADVLSSVGCSVAVADQMPTVGRKFLMAGKSGLNLTKAEPLDDFLERYWALPDPLRQAVSEFGPEEVIAWAEGLGQEVFTGSTGRVFPVVMKASPLLRAWLARLERQGVELRTRWKWIGWDGTCARFETPGGHEVVDADIVILALGGGSWARLGSDGAWVRHVEGVVPFQPSNCGFRLDWTPFMAEHFGTPIKATSLRCRALRSRGEWVITEKGVEGGGIYEVSAAAREGYPILVDLFPDLSAAELAAKWSKKRQKASVGSFLKSNMRLSPAKVALVMEVTKMMPPKSAQEWSELLKALPLHHKGALPMDQAISTSGGVSMDGLTESLMISSRPGVFCAGEMLDWDAPTGGYLLTACLASGRFAAHQAIKWLGISNRDI